MTDIEQAAKSLYESIKYVYFSNIAQQIVLSSAKKDEEKRLKLGAIYNGLQGLRYKIQHLDLSSPTAKKQLKILSDKFVAYKKEYKNLTKKNLVDSVSLI